MQIQRYLLEHVFFQLNRSLLFGNIMRSWAMGFDNIPSLYLPRIHIFQAADYQPPFRFTNMIYEVGANTSDFTSDKLMLVLIVSKSLTLILFSKRFFCYSVKRDPQRVLEG